jgi:hypothetical protein
MGFFTALRALSDLGVLTGWCLFHTQNEDFVSASQIKVF